MTYVMPDLYVLDRQRQRHVPKDPAGPRPADADDQPRRGIERPLQRDRAPDVGRISLSQ